MKKKEAAATAPASQRRPCRHHALWACQGNGERMRRMAELIR